MPVSSTRPIATRAVRPTLSSSTIQNGGMPGTNGIAAMTSAKMRMGSRLCILALVLLFLDRRRRERAQQQHGNQEHENDHLLVVGGIEGRERLDDADDQRRDGREGEADKPAA